MNAYKSSCRVLVKNLHDYCEASDQIDNLEKSTLFFSANTRLNVRDLVNTILGIGGFNDSGRYFGIPSVWGKTKYQAYIRDRMIKKIQGWSRSFVSQAGREVMIKSVINAIPTFSMMCIKLPIKTCKEFDSLISNFW